MPTPISCPTPRTDARTCAAWQTQMAAARKTPGLLPFLVRQRHDVLPGFATAYHQLRALPRRVRRYLQRHWRQSLAGLALGLALGQGVGLADTITVNGTTCTLINAITTANTDVNTGDCVQLPSATAGADTIVLLPNSVHTLTAVDNTTYGANGLPVITSEMTIEGHGSTIERASGAPDFRLFVVTAAGELTLTATTISGGSAAGNGGGIFNYKGVVTLDGCTVSGNTAGNYGGGVFSGARGSGTSAALTITNSTVSGNSGGGGGGGVCNAASLSGVSTVRITNSTISGNSASFYSGGVFNATFGGVSTVTITNSTVSGNSGGWGGGVTNYPCCFGVSTVTITNSTIADNSAFRGGGVSNFIIYGRANARLTLSNSTVSGNSATIGAEVDNLNASLTVVNNYNLFGHSGLTNTKAFHGFTPGATDITATADGTTPTVLSAIMNVTLANNGGRTQTHNLVPGSPAIDASPADGDCPPTDQRGIPRPLGVACDIGAVEFIPSPLPLATSCGTKTPTLGCKVNGVPHQPCLGTPGDDVIVGTPGNDVIFGLGGNDIIKGGAGEDCIDGGPGDDRLEGQDGNDRLFGRSGADQVRGGTGDDLIVTGGGKDMVKGDEGNDLIYDTGGQNTLKGGEGDDVILGPKNKGTIDGDSGTDVCVGGTTQKNCP